MRTLERQDKLGTEAAGEVVGVNGPEDVFVDWSSIDWAAEQECVRRLRQRIFAASQAGDLKRVRNLQKLMLRSRANTLVSVRRVTEVNAGRMTAGVDGRTALLPQSKAELVWQVQHVAASRTPKPVKRVYIPKQGSTTKLRPLGIPVILDRCLQAVVLGALEPEWEARFEPRSYGFRPGRGCHDAIQYIHTLASKPKAQRVWILDADLAAAFDRIDHEHLLRQLGTFPARGRIAGWLKAGVVDRGRFAPTEEGTPQGGVISPCLLNVALHGMETAAGVRHETNGVNAGKLKRNSPAVVRYADDLVALCHSREQAEQVKAKLAGWLEPRGLMFNEGKTRVVHVSEGFDFLGFTVRRYPNGKLLTMPSKAAMKRIRARLSTEMRDLRGMNAEAVIPRLNPIIKGWAAYYRPGASSASFSALDRHMWKLTYKWAKHSHPKKPKDWIAKQYFGRFNRTRQDRWVFGDRATGGYLQKFSWTKIVRHHLVPGSASPDDPNLSTYWAERRRKGTPPLTPSSLRLLSQQRGRCPVCRGLLLHAGSEPNSPQEWEMWLKGTRTAISRKAITVDPRHGTSATSAAHRLLHTHCARRLSAEGRSDPALAQPASPLGLLEPCAS